MMINPSLYDYIIIHKLERPFFVQKLAAPMFEKRVSHISSDLHKTKLCEAELISK